MIRKSVVSSDDVGTPRRCRCQVARRQDCAIVKWQDAQTVPLSSHKMPDCVNVKWQDAQTVPMSSGKTPTLCHCQATKCQTVPMSSGKMPRQCQCQVARRPDCAIVKPQDARLCQCQVARCPDCANVKWQDAQIVPMSSHKMPRLCQCQATRCPDCANVKWQDAQTVPMSSGKMPRLCQCQATRCPDSLSGNTPLRKWVQFPAQQYPADRRTHFFTSAATAKTREASDDVDVKVFLPEAELRLLQYPEPWSQGDPDAFQPFLRHVGQLDHPDVLRGKVLGVALSHRQTDRQTASKLVFYAQSTGAVISGRQKKR